MHYLIAQIKRMFRNVCTSRASYLIYCISINNNKNRKDIILLRITIYCGSPFDIIMYYLYPQLLIKTLKNTWYYKNKKLKL
jgi:hypothetical protein